MTRFPEARWKGDGKSGGSYTSGPWKVVLHTTETRGVPGYSNGYAAPHLTYWSKHRIFYQHTDLEVAARALRNLRGGVQTNRDKAIQLEIVCYSHKPTADRVTNGIWVADLTGEQLGDIRRFMWWCHIEFGVPWTWPGKQAGSYAEANAPGFRMQPEVWDSYAGFVGHQHVPENTHWDPGLLDWNRLMEGDDDMDDLRRGDKGVRVTDAQTEIIGFWARRQIQALPRFGADGDFGGETEEWVNETRTELGFTETGVWTASLAAAVHRDQPHENTSHDHPGYAPVSHGHDSYAVKSHGHDEYATKTHPHTIEGRTVT